MTRKPIRIEVLGGEGINPQALTYAEYRVFAALTQHRDADRIRQVRVLLKRRRPNTDCEAVACTVTISLEGSTSFRIRTVGTHAYAAINRAVERLRMSHRIDELGRVRHEVTVP